MKKNEEKVMMEITKGEAMYILTSRLDDNWKVELEPIIILVPGMLIAYGVYLWASMLFVEWVSIVAALPIIGIAFWMLFKQFKKREKKANILYKDMLDQR